MREYNVKCITDTVDISSTMWIAHEWIYECMPYYFCTYHKVPTSQLEHFLLNKHFILGRKLLNNA